jgi:hypothetical protein
MLYAPRNLSREQICVSHRLRRVVEESCFMPVVTALRSSSRRRGRRLRGNAKGRRWHPVAMHASTLGLLARRSRVAHFGPDGRFCAERSHANVTRAYGRALRCGAARQETRPEPWRRLSDHIMVAHAELTGWRLRWATRAAQGDKPRLPWKLRQHCRKCAVGSLRSRRTVRSSVRGLLAVLPSCGGWRRPFASGQAAIPRSANPADRPSSALWAAWRRRVGSPARRALASGARAPSKKRSDEKFPCSCGGHPPAPPRRCRSRSRNRQRGMQQDERTCGRW